MSELNLENMTSTDKELFQRVCRRLLSETFIVRDADEPSRRQFNFVCRCIEEITAYFKYIGYLVYTDKETGVAMLKEINATESGKELHTGHRKLTKAETILLLCLRLIYGEKLSNGVLAKNIVVSIHDVVFTLDKFGCKDIIDNPSKAEKLFRALSQHNLVRIVGTIGAPDCKVCLYPSLQFSQSPEEMNAWLNSTNRRVFGNAAAEDAPEEQLTMFEDTPTGNEPLDDDFTEDDDND